MEAEPRRTALGLGRGQRGEAGVELLLRKPLAWRWSAVGFHCRSVHVAWGLTQPLIPPPPSDHSDSLSLALLVPPGPCRRGPHGREVSGRGGLRVVSLPLRQVLLGRVTSVWCGVVSVPLVCCVDPAPRSPGASWPRHAAPCKAGPGDRVAAETCTQMGFRGKAGTGPTVPLSISSVDVWGALCHL